MVFRQFNLKKKLNKFNFLLFGTFLTNIFIFHRYKKKKMNNDPLDCFKMEMENTEEILEIQPKRKPRVQSGVPFSQTETLHLIELFKNTPMLWDASTTEYRSNTHKKDSAIIKMSVQLGRDKDDIKVKWQNLKCQYNGELRKIKNRKMNGKEFISRWQFFTPMQFLAKERQITSQRTVSPYLVS